MLSGLVPSVPKSISSRYSKVDKSTTPIKDFSSPHTKPLLIATNSLSSV